MMHKMISMLLVVAMLLSTSVAATAVNVSISDVINLSGMNEVSVTQTVRSYFEARAYYLLGNSTAMDWPVVGIANDEAVHMAQYIAKSISLQYTGYTVERMDCYDTHAEVDAVETITYIKEGVSATEEIIHKLTLIPNDAGLPTVVADGYVEMCSNFESCSYLAPDTRSIMTTSVEDTSCCIVEIARAEIGTVETGTDETKYGEWYGRNGVAWCVIFVSWCANQANVATSVIPKKAGSDSMLAWFDARDSYYRSNAYGGSYTPQPGDIIFIGDKIDDPYHVGLVEKIADGKVWIIDGNWGDKVSHHAYRLTSSMIVGYGSPAYESSGHVFDGYLLDEENHWQECLVCGYTTEGTSHTLNTTHSYDETSHWQGCTTCGYTTEGTSHTLNTTHSYDETSHWQGCTTCDYTTEEISHTLKNTYSYDETHHWHDCVACDFTTQKSIHLTGLTYNYNGNYHWQTCNTCGAIVGRVQHVLILNADGTYRCKMCDCTIISQGGILKVNESMEG